MAKIDFKKDLKEFYSAKNGTGKAENHPRARCKKGINSVLNHIKVH